MPEIQPLPLPASQPGQPARGAARRSTKTRRPAPPRSGDICPACQAGRLDYDGLLNLACPACGHIASGSGGGCS